LYRNVHAWSRVVNAAEGDAVTVGEAVTDYEARKPHTHAVTMRRTVGDEVAVAAHVKTWVLNWSSVHAIAAA